MDESKATINAVPCASSPPLHWREFDTWRSIVLNSLSSLITPEVIDQFSLNPPRYVTSDNLDWLNNLIGETELDGCDVGEILAVQLPRLFRCVRTYHGCAPVDFESYKRDGISPLSIESARSWARTIFLNDKFPSITTEDIDAALADADDKKLREGRVFVVLDRAIYVEDCGHYLLYGSEFLTVVAGALGKAAGLNFATTHLRFRGRPSIAVIDLPWDLITDDDRMILASHMLQAIFEHLKNPDDWDPEIDFTFELERTVPPQAIVSWTFPKKIRDPYTRELFVQNEAGKWERRV